MTTVAAQVDDIVQDLTFLTHLLNREGEHAAALALQQAITILADAPLDAEIEIDAASETHIESFPMRQDPQS